MSPLECVTVYGVHPKKMLRLIWSPFSLYIDLYDIGQYIIIHILVVKRTLHLRANPKDSTIKPTNEVISRDRFEKDSTLY